MSQTQAGWADHNDPRSDFRVGRRITMAAAAADLSDRKMAEALEEYEISISHETFRRITLGQRGVKYSEIQAIADIVDEHISPEVGDPLEWLLRGPYNDGPRPSSADVGIPRYLKTGPSKPLATVTDIRTRKTAHSTLKRAA